MKEKMEQMIRGYLYSQVLVGVALAADSERVVYLSLANIGG